MTNNDFIKIQTEWFKYKTVLYDRASGLPTVSAIMDDVRKLLEQDKIIGILYLSIGEERGIEPIFGWELYDKLIKVFTITVLGQVGQIFPRSSLISISSISGDGFFIFLSKTENAVPITKEYLEGIIKTFTAKIEEMKKEFPHEEVRERINFYSGCEILIIDPMVRTERLIYQTTEDVKYAAYFKKQLRERDLYASLQKIIRNGLISTVYQPIYDLTDKTIYGYEALARGPEDSYFEDPDTIFSFAAKSDLINAVEKISINKAITGAKLLPPQTRLFINITPTLIPQLIDDEFMKLIADTGIKKELIVIEMTEKFIIPEYRMYKEILIMTRTKGFQVALDDVGTGYSTLERIAEISPQYLKYDRTLVKDVDRDLIRQELIKSIADFAHKINAVVIAEGIENDKELDFIKSIGIKLGQGFLLGTPKIFLESPKLNLS